MAAGLLWGKLRTASGALDVTERTGGISTGQVAGWAQTAAGSPYVVTDGSLSGAVKIGGKLFTADGALHITASLPSRIEHGIGFDASGRVAASGTLDGSEKAVFDPILGILLFSGSGALTVPDAILSEFDGLLLGQK